MPLSKTLVLPVRHVLKHHATAALAMIILSSSIVAYLLQPSFTTTVTGSKPNLQSVISQAPSKLLTNTSISTTHGYMFQNGLGRKYHAAYSVGLPVSGSAAVSAGAWMPTNGLYGGNIYSFAINPRDPSIIYTGTEGGSIYKSSNGGTSWTSVSSGLPKSIIWTLAINPNDPSIIYAGTSFGIYKTTNGGSNWLSANTGISYLFIRSLAINPKDPSFLQDKK